MSKAVLIMGESGSGKTTSLRGLDPATTLYLDADGKGLSWKGWRKQYNADSKNYFRTSNPEKIDQLLKAANKSARIKTIVIDTINGVMVDSEMSRIKEAGYGKWSDLAQAGYEIAKLASLLRDDQVVIVLGHSETVTTEDGYSLTRLKTNGRKLEQIVLESKFTTVLLCEQRGGEYVYVTKADNSTAKTPLDMFDTDTIPNDITLVLEQLKEY